MDRIGLARSPGVMELSFERNRTRSFLATGLPITRGPYLPLPAPARAVGKKFSITHTSEAVE